VSDNPISELQRLFADARAKEPFDATACALATSTPEGHPSVRIVLLKDVEPDALIFFTNYDSQKAGELAQNPQCALCLYWPTLGVQVRVEGRAVKTSREESARYFATRPRESQLGAWASRQSTPLGSREELLSRFHEAETRFGDGPVPCPENWGGYRVRPERVEIWYARDHRLHDRVAYTRAGADWSAQRLYP
jgi:pyridoxamine 5'-phosphate oxidase